MAASAGALLVCGTASGVGKTSIVTGLCRVLARRGVRVAPFKAQNVALNAAVTAAGHEIARSQALQAAAARVEPEAAMNPVLCKPGADGDCQVVVLGRPLADPLAGDWPRARPRLAGVVEAALADLRSRFDAVLVEGSGGAAEINLLEADLANLPLARAAGIPAILVGDIERGGVFASLYGTVALLPAPLRRTLRGFVVNKLHGAKEVLAPGIAKLERRCRLPALGVLPHLGALGLDAEDSLSLAGEAPAGGAGDRLDVAVIGLPHLANFTDLDPLACEPGVAVRYVRHPSAFGDPDLVVLPGSKATVADLAWLRSVGLDEALARALSRRSTLLGICAGYQMLGVEIHDEVESRAGTVPGLGLLDVVTTFEEEKVTRRVVGRSSSGEPVVGYEIRHGRPVPRPGVPAWLVTDGQPAGEGVADEARGIYATSVHGLFESDELRHRFLAAAAARRGRPLGPSSVRFAALREARIDRLADALEEHLELEAVLALLGEGAGGR